MVKNLQFLLVTQLAKFEAQNKELEYRLGCFYGYVVFHALAANFLTTVEYHPLDDESQILILMLVILLLLTLFSTAQLSSSNRQEFRLEESFHTLHEDLHEEKGLDSIIIALFKDEVLG